ncbi:hypothetical protein GQR58_009136 [Nymphon striatum]|nr:hypothetical protein GQR58_009136 [Nymphon striatum]
MISANSFVWRKDLLLTLTIMSMFHVYSTNSSDKTSASEKCYHSFQVNRSTIIRTQDSKSEGAKYLDEADKSSHEECLKWCCETVNCTVAVYEEKGIIQGIDSFKPLIATYGSRLMLFLELLKQGSCYLFDCGSADKKFCKFTSYSNYTSAILKVSRHTLELQQLSSSNVVQSSISITTISSTKLAPTAATTNRKEHQGRGRKKTVKTEEKVVDDIAKFDSDWVERAADREDWRSRREALAQQWV